MNNAFSLDLEGEQDQGVGVVDGRDLPQDYLVNTQLSVQLC